MRINKKKECFFVEKKIYSVIQSIMSFSPKEQRLLIMALFSRFKPWQKEEWAKRVCFHAYPETRWIKVDKWMAAQFMKDMEHPPVKVASMALNYFKVNSCMKPFLIKMAQKVKRRIYQRNLRSQSKGFKEG